MTSKVLLCIAALIWGLSFWALPPFDPDLGWHLFGGAWISSHGMVPRDDVINAFNLQWHDYHWLAQVLIYKLFAWGGFDALRIVLGCFMALLFLVLLLSALKENDEPIWTIVVCCAAFYLIGEITAVRPQMIALLVLAISQRILQTNRSWAIPALFLAAVLLANMHVYWLFIPVLWGCYRCIPRMLKLPSAPTLMNAWGGLFIILLAPLISPYGLWGSEPLQNYFLIFEYLDMPKVLQDTILEFRSGLALGNFRSILLLLYVAVFARTIGKRRILENIGNFVITGLTFLLCIIAAKYIGLFAVLSLPYFARNGLSIASIPEAALKFALVLGSIVGVSWTVQHSPWVEKNTDLIDTMEPFKICQSLAAVPMTKSPDHKQLRILTHFNHGGWCKFGLYLANPGLDYRVTTDNRTQGVPGYHYEQSFDLFGLHRNWIGTLNTWNPEVAVVWKNFPLASAMALATKDWEKVLEDDYFAVFKRKAAG